MKLKTFKKVLMYIPIVLITMACDKEYLEVDPKGTFLEDNYYNN